MKFTLIQNRAGNLAKTIKSDGSKSSSAYLLTGRYQEKEVLNLKELNEILEEMTSDMAIILGTSEESQGHVVIKELLTEYKKDNPKAHIITRSKEYFKFDNETILLIDIDTDDGDNIECKSYEDVLGIVKELDPQFENAEILIRHSSSSFIYKWEKGEKIEVKGAGSYHIYVKATNVLTGLDAYITRLEERAFGLGYGYFKVSKSGSLLKRQVFDSTVFSPERLVFEAGMVCEAPYEQERPEAYYCEGGFIDCAKLPTVDAVTVQEEIDKAMAKVSDKAEQIRSDYRSEQISKLMDAGYSEVVAKSKVESMISDNILCSEHVIKLSDGSSITAKDVFLNPEKYDKMSCFDPIEPEKGSGKAIIYSNQGVNPIINSFVHGGVRYRFDVDYITIYHIAKNAVNDSSNDSTVKYINDLANKANLSTNDRANIGRLLKDKGIAKSIHSIQLSPQEKQAQGEESGYVDFTKYGTIAPTVNNLVILMTKNNMEYSYDVIKKTPYMNHPDINLNAPNFEEAIVSLIERFAIIEGIDISITKHISSIANNNYSNPLMDYVLDCHGQYLEGNQNVDYIKQVADVINTNAPTFYVEAILKTWFVQCVASWDFERTTPCVGAKEKYESVLVLQGGQGVQKTKFFSALLPSKQQHYIKTGAMLNPSDKDSLMQNTAYGVVELGELDTTFNKSDIGALKAFLSNSIDEYRAPYGKTASKHKRCTSYCGSVNESGFLRDPTGARRFWVIPANTINFKSFEMIDKDMLWGQVYDLYIHGEKWWFDETDTEVNVEIQNLHNLHRAYSLADEVFTQVKHSTAPKQWLSVTKIYQNYSDERASRKDGSDLTSLLEHAGFSRNARKEFLVPCAPVPVSVSVPIANNFEYSNDFLPEFITA